MSMKKNMEKTTIKETLEIIKNNYLFEIFFIISNLINGLILRIVTVSNGLSISPLLIDLFFLIIISLLSLLFKGKARVCN